MSQLSVNLWLQKLGITKVDGSGSTSGAKTDLNVAAKNNFVQSDENAFIEIIDTDSSASAKEQKPLKKKGGFLNWIKGVFTGKNYYEVDGKEIAVSKKQSLYNVNGTIVIADKNSGSVSLGDDGTLVLDGLKNAKVTLSEGQTVDVAKSEGVDIDASNGGFIKTGDAVQEYGAGGKLLSETTIEEKDFDADGTANKVYVKKQYDENGNLTSTKEISNTPNEYYNQTIKELDADGNLISTTQNREYSWNTADGGQNTKYEQVIKDENGNVVKYNFAFDSGNDGTLDSVYKEINEFDENGNQITEIKQHEGGSNLSIKTWEYDQNGNELSASYYWDENSDGAPEATSNKVSTYDENGKLLTSNYKENNVDGSITESNTVVEGDKTTTVKQYDKDGDGKFDSSYKSSWEEGEGKYIYEYEADENNDGTAEYYSKSASRSSGDDYGLESIVIEKNGNQTKTTKTQNIFENPDDLAPKETITTIDSDSDGVADVTIVKQRIIDDKGHQTGYIETVNEDYDDDGKVDYTTKSEYDFEDGYKKDGLKSREHTRADGALMSSWKYNSEDNSITTYWDETGDGKSWVSTETTKYDENNKPIETHVEKITLGQESQEIIKYDKNGNKETVLSDSEKDGIYETTTKNVFTEENTLKSSTTETDANNDGKIDYKESMNYNLYTNPNGKEDVKGSRLEIDSNGDGVVDKEVYEWYRENEYGFYTKYHNAGYDSTTSEDLDGDGIVDKRTYISYGEYSTSPSDITIYQNTNEGEVKIQGTDTDGDGKMNESTTFIGGPENETIKYDTNGDGKADKIEKHTQIEDTGNGYNYRYKYKVEVDNNGDGIVDEEKIIWKNHDYIIEPGQE